MTNFNKMVIESIMPNLSKLLKPECVMRGKETVCKDMGWEKKADRILKRKGKLK